jgi:hypothetical protein
LNLGFDTLQAIDVRGIETVVLTTSAAREGFQNVGSCCGAVVFVDESAESVAARYFAAGPRGCRACRLGRQQRESTVRALVVVGA